VRPGLAILAVLADEILARHTGGSRLSVLADKVCAVPAVLTRLAIDADAGFAVATVLAAASPVVCAVSTCRTRT